MKEICISFFLFIIQYIGDTMLKGSIVALITPFDENNEIDYGELNRLLDFHIQNQTDGLLLLGTTAEAESLTETERIEIVRYILSYLDGRIKVMVGIIIARIMLINLSSYIMFQKEQGYNWILRW